MGTILHDDDDDDDALSFYVKDPQKYELLVHA